MGLRGRRAAERVPTAGGLRVAAVAMVAVAGFLAMAGAAWATYLPIGES